MKSKILLNSSLLFLLLILVTGIISCNEDENATTKNPDPNLNVSCKADSECSGGTLCKNNMCSCPEGQVIINKECAEACPSGKVLVDGECKSFDGACPENEVVEGGVCVTAKDCSADTDCNEGQKCGNEGKCVYVVTTKLGKANYLLKAQFDRYYALYLDDPKFYDDFKPVISKDAPGEESLKVIDKMLTGKFWVRSCDDASCEHVNALFPAEIVTTDELPSGVSQVDGDNLFIDIRKLTTGIQGLPNYPSIPLAIRKLPSKAVYVDLIFDNLLSEGTCKEGVLDSCSGKYDARAMNNDITSGGVDFAGKSTPTNQPKPNDYFHEFYNPKPMTRGLSEHTKNDFEFKIGPNSDADAPFIFGTVHGLKNCNSALECEMNAIGMDCESANDCGLGMLACQENKCALVDKPCGNQADCGEGFSCTENKCVPNGGGATNCVEKGCSNGEICDQQTGVCNGGDPKGPEAKKCSTVVRASCPKGETCIPRFNSTEGYCAAAQEDNNSNNVEIEFQKLLVADTIKATQDKVWAVEAWVSGGNGVYDVTIDGQKGNFNKSTFVDEYKYETCEIGIENQSGQVAITGRCQEATTLPIKACDEDKKCTTKDLEIQILKVKKQYFEKFDLPTPKIITRIPTKVQ